MAPVPTPEEIKLLELAARHAIAEENSLPQRVDGKLSARERIETLLDKDTFEETGKFVTHIATDGRLREQHPPGDGVITGFGRIHGRIVCVFAHDATVFDGTVSEANAAKVVKLMDTAVRIGAPLISLHDSSGLRIQEGIAALAGYGDILLRSTIASGIIPQISAIFGACSGVAALAPALTDVTLTGTNEPLLLASIRELLSYLPSSKRDALPHLPTSDIPSRADRSLDTLIPAASDQTYDMHDVIILIIDQDETGKGSFFELNEDQADGNILTGFARMNGHPVGIVANQSASLAGVLDSDACFKAARFVRFCDSFNIPLITFVDTPGLHPSLQPQQAAQLLCAFAKATVPKLTVITRKAHGTAYAVMGSKHLRADLNLAWPTAEISAASPDDAIDILYRRELKEIARRAEAIMPQGVTLSEEQKLEILAEARKERVDEYRERFANPYLAAERGYIDAVIRPSETRRRLNSALDIFSTRNESKPTN